MVYILKYIHVYIYAIRDTIWHFCDSSTNMFKLRLQSFLIHSLIDQIKSFLWHVILFNSFYTRRVYKLHVYQTHMSMSVIAYWWIWRSMWNYFGINRLKIAYIYMYQSEEFINSCDAPTEWVHSPSVIWDIINQCHMIHNHTVKYFLKLRLSL